ncbi:hypothetical protein GE09DRAFT_1055598 [Coniochaeta sp. 2T2.1]|nr:hypothetical protein GE09DRAFT_1055598 [Coniochaeta sp. 2T2.1]
MHKKSISIPLGRHNYDVAFFNLTLQQLAFTTSSQKKRRITRQSAREPDLVTTNSSSPADLVLPSTEEESDPFFSSFTTTAPGSGLSTPTYVRADSLQPSGVPPRLQATHNSSFTAPDYTSSAASSPCAASADLSFDNDRGADGLDSSLPHTVRRQPSLINPSHRALIGGAVEMNHRSSSPLKRRASSMDPDHDVADTKEEDVDMLAPPQAPVSPATQGSAHSDGDSNLKMDGATDPTSDSQKTLVGEQGLPIRGGEGSHGSDNTITELPLRSDAPPLREQIQTIQSLLKAFSETPVQDGDTAYLVSKAWLDKAQAFSNGVKNAGKSSSDVTLGAVDNSDIILATFTDANSRRFAKLRPGLGPEDFEVFSKDAWDLLVEWHGLADGQEPILRTAHNTNPDANGVPNVQYEYYPPVFSIHRVWSAASPLPVESTLKSQNPPPPLLVHSSSDRLHDLLKEAKTFAGIPLSVKVRVWRTLQTLPAGDTSTPVGLSTPPSSPESEPNDEVVLGAFPHLLIEVDKFLKLQKGVERDLIEDAHDSTHHDKYNGSRTLAMTGLTVDHALVLDENTGKKDEWVTTCVAKSSGPAKGLAPRVNSSVQKGTGSGRSSPAPSVLTRGRTQRSGRTLGCVGLQNLGNTCYMNSALQCVRSVEELTKYFLTNEAEKEINEDNPLSHNGDVARAYGRLLSEIYKDPPPTSIAPRQFKNVIGRYAPSFSGYGQQDSQEFLGFLLDGLQEDLNRIKNKPYIQKPDSTDDMIGNPALIQQMAEQVWDITKKRDDSVIADLFTGLYQSTVVCPVCAKVSITFDPFTNLTLPLPLGNVWSHRVFFYPLNDAPVELTVELSKSSTIKALKEFVSARVGVPVELLMAGEVFNGKFFKLYEDLSAASEEIGKDDVCTVHELEALPTNLPLVKLPKKQKYRSLLEPDEETAETPVWEEPASKRIVIPVLHRMVGGEKYNSRRRVAHVPPHFIVLTVDEACDEDIIRRKVLEKVATYSTFSVLHQDGDDSAQSTEPELVNTSSDGDSQLIAKSVEGEEELVDVHMKDATSNPVAAIKYPKQLKKFNSRRPKFVDPKEFLLPELQNLFALSYFSSTDANEFNVPSGWAMGNDNGPFPRLSTRQPKRSASDVEMNSPSWDGSEDTSGSDERSNSQPSVTSATTRMVDESSGDDSDIPPVENAPSRLDKAGRRQKKRAQKTYGKGKKRQAKQQQKESLHNSYYLKSAGSLDSEGQATDGGPLVRYGEGIIADWQESAWDLVFSGIDPDGPDGVATFMKPEELVDETLKKRQEARDRRRKHGITLDDCLAEFEKEEVLSEQDTWYCPRCKEMRRASKKFDLWKTPDILAVHLKRFSSAGYRREKLDILVDFPIEGLDLTTRVIDKEDGKQEIYDLIAVDDHWGGLGGGHYTAFAKNFIDGEWYSYNDTSVSKQNDVSKIVTSAAYLLFYRRRSDTPLGGPRFQEIFEHYDQQTRETDDSDSGEDQRLGHGSSPRGSSSALQTGAGATLRSGKGGSDSVLATSIGDAAVAGGGDYENMLPNYGAALSENVAEDAGSEGAIPGLHSWQNPISAVADDEGIGMEEWSEDPPAAARRASQTLEDAVRTGWNFGAIESGGLARSEADDAINLNDGDADSTTAQNDDMSSLDDILDEEGDFTASFGIDTNDHVPMMHDDGGHPVMFDQAPPPYDDLPSTMTGVVVTAEQIAHEVGGQAEHIDQTADSRVDEIHLSDDEDRIPAVSSATSKSARAASLA